ARVHRGGGHTSKQLQLPMRVRFFPRSLPCTALTRSALARRIASKPEIRKRVNTQSRRCAEPFPCSTCLGALPSQGVAALRVIRGSIYRRLGRRQSISCYSDEAR